MVVVRYIEYSHIVPSTRKEFVMASFLLNQNDDILHGRVESVPFQSDLDALFQSERRLDLAPRQHLSK